MAKDSGKKLKLIGDMKVRWNSTFRMIKRALELKNIYVSICNVEDDLAEYGLQESEWRYLDTLASLLENFDKLTTNVSATKSYPTIPKTIALYNILMDQIEDFVTKYDDQYPDLCRGASTALTKLKKYYSRTDTTPIYAIGTAMHPALRYHWWSVQKWEDIYLNDAKNSVRRVWSSQYEKENAQSVLTELDAEDDAEIFEFQLLGMPISTRSNELEEYASGKSVPTKILQFWKQNQKVFPQLSRMAKHYLAIPATSAASERCFSQARVLLPYNRSKLSEASIRVQMLLGSWMKYYQQESDVSGSGTK